MTWSDPDIQTVAPEVIRVPVPLPHDALKAVNVYMIEGDTGVTLIDAGWDSPLALQAVKNGLAFLDADMPDVERILVTHVHYDHIGQATALGRAGAGGYWLGKGDKSTFDHMTTDPQISRANRVDLLRQHGAVELADQAGDTLAMMAEQAVDWDQPDRWMIDGDVQTSPAGDVHALATPGHTAGHMCFHHPDKGLLFAGDHVLPHITPSIGLEGVTKPLALSDFLTSLARVRNLDVDVVLPAHGEVFSDLAGRVDALTTHHEIRLQACLDAIAPGRDVTAYAVATRLPWTRRQTAFGDLDLFNKALATYETAAHLELLAKQGQLTRNDFDGVVSFGR